MAVPTKKEIEETLTNIKKTKKSKPKKTTKIKTTSRKRTTKDDVIRQLIENNISLQEKNIELINAISKLNNKISEMVDIFNEAAKHIKAGTDEPLIQKLEKLLDQNKVIANGLILLEKYIREKSAMSQQFSPQQQFSPKPLKRPNL
jgi:predicted RNase H-like nuclease (RuvC/YqgF family)